MTVKELIEVLQSAPQGARVIIEYEDTDIPIGISWAPIFINKNDEVCLFMDVDETKYIKKILASRDDPY